MSVGERQLTVRLLTMRDMVLRRRLMAAVVMEVRRRMSVLCLIAIFKDDPLASLDEAFLQHQISSL